jgi:Uma2 family endonuclease
MRATLDEFMRLPEGTLAEFIGGDILMSPSPRLRHQRVVFRIHQALNAFVRPRGLGEAFEAPADVHLPSGDVVQPDVLFVSAARSGILQDWVRGAPDLVVEVLSPESRRRDLEVKPGLYAANGVVEVWIADPDARTIEIRTAAGTALVPAGGELTTPLLPGFVLRSADVFAP